MKNKVCKTDGIPSSLLKYLGTPLDYLTESVELINDFTKIKDKYGDKDIDYDKLTEKEKKVLKRSSELVLLIETTKSMYNIK